MLCPRCGATLRDTARFCNRCRYQIISNAEGERLQRASRPLRPGAGLAAPISRPLNLDRATVDLSGAPASPQTAALDPAAAWLGPASDERQAIADQETTENAAI